MEATLVLVVARLVEVMRGAHHGLVCEMFRCPRIMFARAMECSFWCAERSIETLERESSAA